MGTDTLSPLSSLWQCNDNMFSPSDPYWNPFKNPNKNATPCTIFYTAKMKIFLKGKTVDTTKLQLVGILHPDFEFYNITSIYGFVSIITFVCAKTRIIWSFFSASKQSPVITVRFIPATLDNEQLPCKSIRVYEDGSL